MSAGSTRRRTGSSWHRSFSRLFSRSSSKEQEEESRGAPELQSAHSFEIKEDESTSVGYPRKDNSPLPELLKISVCKNKDFSTEELNRSTTQEELKKAKSLPSLVHESKADHNKKQAKEGFFQYLGSLFGIASKSSYKESEPSNFGDGHHKYRKDFANLGNHQNNENTEQLKSEIFVISSSKSEQELSDKDINVTARPDLQNLQTPQAQSIEPTKKTDCEPTAPAITYATYRGPARIKQLLKKQAELEEEKETRISINSSIMRSKKRQTVNPLSSETTTEPESSLKNATPEIKDDKQSTQESMLLTEIDQRKNVQDILTSSEHNKINNKITLFTEIEITKNCIEELVSMKCLPVSEKSEVNRNILLQPPVFLPNQPSSSFQNIGSLGMHLENSRLIEKSKALDNMQMQLQSNSADAVCFQKGMHICVLPDPETKVAIQNDLSSYPKVDATNIEDKYPCITWTADQFKLESDNQLLYVNSTTCSGQIDRRTNGSQELNRNATTENHDHLLLRISRVSEELPLDLPDVTSGILVQPRETIQCTYKCSKSGLDSKEATKPLLSRDMQSSSNFSMMAEIGTNKTIAENVYMPVVELDRGGIRTVLLSATAVNNSNISLLDVECNNVNSSKTDVDDIPQRLEDKKDSCCHLPKINKDKTLIQPLPSLDVCLPSFEEKHKCFELEKLKRASNAESSPLKAKEIDAIETPDISAKTSFVKSEKTNLPVNSIAELPALVSNAVILEDNCPSDTLAKPISNFKDQNSSSYSLHDKRENAQQSVRQITEANSAVTDFGKTCYSVSDSESIQGILKSENVLEFEKNVETKIIPDNTDTDITKSNILPQTGSYSMDSKSILVKEALPDVAFENVYTHKSVPSTTFKDTSNLYSSACEAMETVVLDEIDSLPINFEEFMGNVSSIHKSNCISSESTFLPPLLASDASESSRIVLEMPLTTMQSKEIPTAPSGQIHFNCLVAPDFKNYCGMDEQAIAVLLTKSNNQVFEEHLKDVEIRKQLQIKSKDLSVLFKKAEEIVDSVINLAIEEIRSKQAAGIYQSNINKDNILGPNLLKNQEARKMPSKSKETQSRNYFTRLFKLKGKDEFGNDSQNENENLSLNISDKTGLCTSAMVKPKELIGSINKAAKENLTAMQHLSKDISQDTDILFCSEETDVSVATAELTTKLPPKIEKSMKISLAYPAEEHKIIAEGITDFSAPLNFKEKNKKVSGEIIQNNVTANQTICEEWYDTIGTLESGPGEINNGINIKDADFSTYMATVSESINDWTLMTITPCKQLPSRSDLAKNALSFNSNTNTCSNFSNKCNDERTSLGSPRNNIEKELPKNEIKESKATSAVREEPHEKCYEMHCERGNSKVEDKGTLPHDNGFNSPFNVSESSLLNSSSNIGLVHEEVINSGSCVTMDNLLNEYYLEVDNDNGNAEKLQNLVFPLPEEQQYTSSFTLVYGDTVQDGNYSVSRKKEEHPLSHPDLTLDSKNVHIYDESSSLNKMLHDSCSESFTTVEAKRYRIYPFSLSPIYEDDSSQEDLCSTDNSPGDQSSEKTKDNQSLSVLSLLQSVSERLKSSNQCKENYDEEKDDELCEGKYQEDEKQAYISSTWPNNKSTKFPEDFSRHHFPKEEFSSLFNSTYSTNFIQKFDPVVKPFSKSICYESLPGLTSNSSEKETTLNWQPESKELLKLLTSKKCPVERDRLKCNPRPGKMLICDFHGNTNKHEIYCDVVDATVLVFSKEASIRVVRGCWILYEKPAFQGLKHILEEGEMMLSDILNLYSKKTQGNFTIGSIKHIMKDCSIPEIELCPHNSMDHFPVCIHNAVADLNKLEVENPILSVNAGVWLAYSDTDYKGEVMILEENQNPYKISTADVKSLRPLKMGGLKVQMPTNTMMIIYEKPQFKGWCKKLSENTDCIPILFENANEFQGIGSICIIGGIWVAYEKERYKGQQYLLEEGEYDHWQSWGGINSVLRSVRFLQADFMESEVTLFKTDEENGSVLNVVNQEIPDLDQAGFGAVTRSVNVKSGVWVAYQQKYFCGEQYILEKGKYKCFFDWGGPSETIKSIRPVKLEPLGNHEPIHWIKAFDNTHFQGRCIEFTEEVADFTSFMPCSFKVLRGCWLLYYEGKTDDQCVLEEDLYTDLASCGCPTTKIKCLKPVDHVFAEPFISLFALENCEGRELHLHEAVSSVLSQELHFFTQSLCVRSGLWIAYEGCNFSGKQFLLEPSKISNWTQFSGWKAIGSLRPVKQPAVYFRIKNRSQEKYLTVSGNVMNARVTSVTLSPWNGKNTQIWRYSYGLIKSKVNDACLDVIGGKDIPGAKVALWAEHGKARQKWTLNKDGTITSYLSDQLVLDIKGGYYYDRNHIIVNQLNLSEYTQKWDLEIL